MVRSPGVGLGHQYRIIRRGMPYGPEWVPGDNDDADRGLLGLFICSSLFNQFEILMSTWVNGSFFPADLPAGERDPMIGANEGGTGTFEVPGRGTCSGFGRFVHTRGGSYVFFPGITALRRIAQR